MTSTVYAIGDVHGRSDLLARMIKFIREHSQRFEGEPRVFFLGDIVDRGPDSCGAMKIVCETLRCWPRSRLLLGNHDLFFRDAMTKQNFVRHWLENGGLATLRSYIGDYPDYSLDEMIEIGERFPDHLNALRDAPIILPIGRYVFVHAGIDPSVPLSDQDLNVCLQARTKFTEHIGLLSHVVVHGHTPLDPPRPVITENRISLDTNAYHSGVLSMAVIDTERDDVELFSTAEDGFVRSVAPVLLNRGLGTAWTTTVRNSGSTSSVAA
ncbi:serine/threonine protein phosphatase 1 [Nitrobacteraceae bacterium AZCC 2161]